MEAQVKAVQSVYQLVHNKSTKHIRVIWYCINMCFLKTLLLIYQQNMNKMPEYL